MKMKRKNAKNAVTAGILVTAMALPAMAADLYGGGATYPAIPYGILFNHFEGLTGDDLFYCAVGSGGGKAVQIGTVNADQACGPGFAAPLGHTRPNYIGTDAPYAKNEYQTFLSLAGGSKTALVQVPALVGAVVLPFNNPDIAGTLNVTVTQACDLFDNTYTNWNQLNPSLPSKPIKWVYRGSNSGTTFAFSNFIAANCNPPPPSPPVVTTNQLYAATGMPMTIAVNGNLQMVTTIKATDGAIGYADPGDVVTQGATYIRINGADPLSFTSPTFTASDLLIDEVVVPGPGPLPSTAPLATEIPSATRLSALLMVKPTKTVSSGYPIFAPTYLATYARGNDDADAGSDVTAAGELQFLLSCLVDSSLGCFEPPYPGAGFDFIDLDASALAVVYTAIAEIQN